MKVLVVAAHPDDEIIGCGGTMAKHSDSGDEVYVLIMSEGVSAQYKDKEKFLKLRREACLNANKSLGVKEVIFKDFPDARMDSISQLEINRTIEEIVEKINPDRVYTHHWGDLHKDHRIVFDSTVVATRNRVKEVLCYEVLGSTNKLKENKSMMFAPNCYINIEKQLDKKLNALSFYATETKKFPHPLSKESLEILAKYHGIESSLNAAESFVFFKNIREI